MKHLFIVNPAAGKGKTLQLIPLIEQIFENKDEDYIIEVTNKAGHAIEIAKYYSSIEDYRIYSIGGDGTLNEVLNGMAGSKSSLAVIPSGSGNDFIKSIYNFRKDENIQELLIKTIEGREKSIDLGILNNRYFLNISSVGFDAEVVNNSLRFKKLPFIGGATAYILGILTTVFKYNSHKLTIDIDGNSFSVDSLLTAIANGKYYGGGMKVAPEADINDGFFSVCVIKKISKLRILVLFPKLVNGTHGAVKEVSFYYGKTITIKSDKVIAFNIDGELRKGTEAKFQLIPEGLKIVIPSIN